MALTVAELQQVLSMLQTNSLRIDQLTPATSLKEDDWFEIAGGKKVSFAVIKQLISLIFTGDIDTLKTLISKNELKSADITVSESSVTLKISSTNKTISATIPAVTNSKAGIMTAEQYKAITEQWMVEQIDKVEQLQDSVGVTYTRAQIGNAIKNTTGFEIAAVSDEQAGVLSAGQYRSLKGGIQANVTAIAGVPGKIGVVPFQHFSYRPTELSGVADGQIAWSVAEQRFFRYIADGNRWTDSGLPDYNTLAGSYYRPRADMVYVHDGSIYFAEKTADEEKYVLTQLPKSISEILDNFPNVSNTDKGILTAEQYDAINTAIRNNTLAIGRLPAQMGVLHVDRTCYRPNELSGVLDGQIVWSAAERRFFRYQAATDSWTDSVSDYNTWLNGTMQPRVDRVYVYENGIYYIEFDGEKYVLTQLPTEGAVKNIVQEKADSINRDMQSLESWIERVEENTAPVDASGKIPARYIPGSYDDVLEFDDFVDIHDQNIPVERETPKSASDPGYQVVYDLYSQSFMLWNEDENKIYEKWPGSDLYGAPTNEAPRGAEPYAGKVYVNTGLNKTYRWSGSSLAVIGTDLALGHTNTTAFPGDEGLTLQDDVTNLKRDVRNNKTAITAAETAAKEHANKADTELMTIMTDVMVKADAALQEDTGILPIGGIVDSIPESLEPMATALADPNADLGQAKVVEVVFVRAEGKFYTRIEKKIGLPATDDRYVAEGQPRNDRLYRHGSTLYRVIAATSGGVATIEEIGAKEALFIDIFDRLAGSYGKFDYANAPDKNKPYYLNELWLSYQEAIDVVEYGRDWCTTQPPQNITLRTNILACQPGFQSNYMVVEKQKPFFKFAGETARVSSDGANFYLAATPYNLTPNMDTNVFESCPNLRKILGSINIQYLMLRVKTQLFTNCPLLEEVNLVGVGTDTYLGKLPKLCHKSLRFLVDENNPSGAITVTVHTDIYNVMTGVTDGELNGGTAEQWRQLLSDAVAKNISFASA